MLYMNETGEHHTKWNKPIMKRKILLIIPLIWGAYCSQIHREGKENGSCPELGGGAKGELLSTEYMSRV